MTFKMYKKGKFVDNLGVSDNEKGVKKLAWLAYQWDYDFAIGKGDEGYLRIYVPKSKDSIVIVHKGEKIRRYFNEFGW